MGTAIVVTSGKGGTGKTSSVGALASCLAIAGYKTLCLDCDIGLRNLDLTLGMSSQTVTNFVEVATENLTLEDAVSKHPDIDNLYLLSSPHALSEKGLSYAQMQKMIFEIKADYDYCLIDSPAGIGSGFRMAACCADKAIVVVTPDLSSIRGAQHVVSELERIGVSSIRLLVNRINPSRLKKAELDIDSIIDTVGAQLIGLVREDPDVSLAANWEAPLVLCKTGGAMANFRRIAGRITGKNIPLRKI